MNLNEWKPVPEEISDLFDDAEVSEQCRDLCVASFWKAKRAIMYGREARKSRRKAWQLVYDLYPELEHANLEYNFKERAVRVKPAACQTSVAAVYGG